MKRDESYLVANCRDEIHLDKHNLIRDSQHGFRKGYSCTTNLLTFLENVTEEIKSNHSVDTIYLDLVKAFGKVPHQRLISKLKAHGVDGLVVSWIKARLSGIVSVSMVHTQPTQDDEKIIRMCCEVVH